MLATSSNISQRSIPRMPERIWDYDIRLDLAARQKRPQPLPVLSVVIWTCPGQTPSPVYHQDFQGLVLAHKDYVEIHLLELDWQHPADPLVLVLAPYFQTVTPADLVPIAVQLYTSAPVDQRDFLVGSLLALGDYKFGDISDIKQLVAERIGKAMDEFFEAMSQSSFGVAIRERAEAEGEAKGEATSRRHDFGQLWRIRFKQELDAALLDRIVALPQEQYDRIFIAVVEGILTSAQVLALLDA